MGPMGTKGQHRNRCQEGLDYDEGGCFDGAGNVGNEGARGIMDRAKSSKINPFGINILVFYIIFYQLESF